MAAECRRFDEVREVAEELELGVIERACRRSSNSRRYNRDRTRTGRKKPGRQ